MRALLAALLGACGDVVIVPVRVAMALPRVDRARAWGYAADLGHRSFFFVSVVMGFVGAIMVVQTANQALQIIGDLSPVGPIFLELLVREMGPAIVGLMVAARSAAALAAEAGVLTTSEQMDALRLCGSGPTQHLSGPALLGSLLVIPSLVVMGTAVAYLTGGLVAHGMYDVGYGTYFDFSMVAASDLCIGLAKGVAFAVVIPVMAVRAGLRARGGAAGVGRAATHGVIGASIFVLAVDLFIGVIAHLLVWG